MKRILVIGMSESRGGMESYLINLYRRLDKQKFQFDFYLPHDAPKAAYEDEIAALGGIVYRAGYGRAENPFRHYKNIIDTYKNHPELTGVYLNTCVLLELDHLIIAKFLKRPIRIVHSHNSGYMSRLSFGRKLIERINKWTLGFWATQLLACSDAAGRWMFGKRKFLVVCNGIETEKYRYNAETRLRVRRALGVEDKLVVGTVGRIQYQKNPAFVVELFFHIAKRRSDAVLLWAGDGEPKEVAEITGALRKKQIETRVLLLGSRSDVNELYQAMDIFVLPSRFEGLSFALVEAQCAGLTCFTSLGDVPKEADVTGRVRYLPLSLGAAQWSEEILKNTPDDAARSDQSAAVRRKGYSIENTVSVMEQVLERCERAYELS